MNAHSKIPSDIIGLMTPPPLSRRNFFMTASAATAAGYTLAAGPVRADAIKTDTNGLKAGDATVAWAKSQGGDTNRLGIMGFCRGGRSVWHYSTHNPNLKAGVAFYGSLIDKSDAVPKNSIELAPEVKEPVLGLYGAEDTGIKVEQVKEMEEKLKAAGKTAEFHIYPGAPHGFNADYRPSYRKEAAEDAWKRMTDWFKKYKVLS